MVSWLLSAPEPCAALLSSSVSASSSLPADSVVSDSLESLLTEEPDTAAEPEPATADEAHPLTAAALPAGSAHPETAEVASDSAGAKDEAPAAWLSASRGPDGSQCTESREGRGLRLPTLSRDSEGSKGKKKDVLEHDEKFQRV